MSLRIKRIEDKSFILLSMQLQSATPIGLTEKSSGAVLGLSKPLAKVQNNLDVAAIQ